MDKKQTEEKQYDLKELRRLWALNYKELAQAPGEPNARLREARFIMQAKVAWETRRYMLVTTAATVMMAIFTIVIAIATAISTVAAVFTAIMMNNR